MIIKLTNDFKNNFKKLNKKYKSIKNDINTLVFELKKNPKIWKDLWNWLYKIRIKNSDNNKWKSWWYRTITYYNDLDIVVLLTIYSKSEKENIFEKELLEILKKYKNGTK